MAEPSWQDVGSVEELKTQPLRQIKAAKTLIALSYMHGEFAVVSGVCNHVGGPLGEGTLDGDYIVCPWHYWKFHRMTGEGEPGFDEDMENNVRYVKMSKELRAGARALVERSVEIAKALIGGQLKDMPSERGGRKAHQLDVKVQL